MKQLITLLIVFFCSFAKGQIVNIPDANFKAKLLSASASNQVASTLAPSQYGYVTSYHKIDINNDGEIQVSEAVNIKCLKIRYSNISNLTGIESFTQLRYLDCEENEITSLDFSQNILLLYLYCENNNLNNLNITQNINLYKIECQNNLLTNLNLSGCNYLNTLVCYTNLLNSLDVSQNTYLKHLSCGYNSLFTLDVSQNIYLEHLYCQSTQLSTIDTSSNNNLYFFYCDNNFLTNLDVTSNPLLKDLYCSSNQLTMLNLSQNTNLEELNCYNNYLTSIDISQCLSLLDVNCSNNQLTVLDVSQNLLLDELSCNNNLIVSLDVSHSLNLLRLICNNNLLNSLKINNNNQEFWYNSNIDFSNNPNLQYICADEEDISMVVQKINQYGYAATCHVNSYCSFTPGGTFYNINGNNRFDSNNNGCESTDINFPNLNFTISNGTDSGTFIPNNSGFYSFPVSEGTHTITPNLQNPSYFTISPTSVTASFPTQASPFVQDFCVTANGVHSDVQISLIPIGVARPGFDANYKLVYKNIGNQLENGLVSFISYNLDVVDFVSSVPVFSTQNEVTNQLSFIWNYSNLAPFETREIIINLNLNSPMEIPALNSGDVLSYEAQISTTNTDENHLDNFAGIRQEVVNSYDPNDKTCLEGAIIDLSLIGKYVHYQIRFENTGTYHAQNVVVKDIIDATKFDVTSLQMVNSSHSCYTRINGNKVEFIFENINLPFEDATNDGYLVFKIKTLPTLTTNSSISNTAEIYFDYNFPIITNTATSTYQTLENPSFDFENEFVLYPNPVKNSLTINAKNRLEIQLVELYNLLGQLVIAKPNFEQTIDVSALKTGTYFVKVNTEKGSGSVKFIKE